VSPAGQIVSLFIISVAAAEAIIGLGLLIKGFKLYQRLELNRFTNIN
jgi:NADH:ubiquinone oxidoreductase subunit K